MDLSAALHITNFTLPEMLGNVTIREMAEAFRDPSHRFNRMVETSCSQGCGATFQCRAYFATVTACDACYKKGMERHELEALKENWEHICPASFRNTETNHPDFPKAQWEATRTYLGEKSLLLFGPSRKGKTRLAMLILKRCLHKRNKIEFDENHHFTGFRKFTVGVMWEEDIDQAKSTFDRKALIAKWGRYDLLLMDDALLASARDDRTTAFLKNLIDYRMRHERHMIITSQIGADDYKQSGVLNGQIKKQDEARIDALLARVREICTVIPFDAPKPSADTEEAF